MSFPFLRVVGGILLVVAGLVAYSGVSIGASAALILVFGGVVLLAVVFLGHRPRPWDAAVFIVGLLALSAASAGYSFSLQPVTYSATRAQVPYGAISLTVTASTGSVFLGFTNRTDLAYQVNFSAAGGLGGGTVTNSTTGGIFNLKVSSSWSAVSVLVGRGYILYVNVNTVTGSIDMNTPGALGIRNVSLVSSFGSVSAVVDSSDLAGLVLRDDLGSVSLVSHHLGAAAADVPISVSSSTGSVSMDVRLGILDAASLTASAGIGSVSQSLSGFSISQDTTTKVVATAGSFATAPRSFVISANSGLGSVSITAGFG